MCPRLYSASIQQSCVRTQLPGASIDDCSRGTPTSKTPLFVNPLELLAMAHQQAVLELVRVLRYSEWL